MRSPCLEAVHRTAALPKISHVDRLVKREEGDDHEKGSLTGDRYAERLRASRRNVIKSIRREIDEAHAVGTPVIYLCDTHAPDDKEFAKFGWPPHAVGGTKGAEVIAELKPSPQDIVVPKTTYSGFYGTELGTILKTLGTDSLRLTGCVTHICILFTASDAVLRDYAVTVVEDGVAGLAKEDHDAALRIMQNVLGVKILQGVER
jgi:nicotinamidase/pyrazinamidase